MTMVVSSAAFLHAASLHGVGLRFDPRRRSGRVEPPPRPARRPVHASRVRRGRREFVRGHLPLPTDPDPRRARPSGGSRVSLFLSGRRGRAGGRLRPKSGKRHQRRGASPAADSPTACGTADFLRRESSAICSRGRPRCRPATDRRTGAAFRPRNESKMHRLQGI